MILCMQTYLGTAIISKLNDPKMTMIMKAAHRHKCCLTRSGQHRQRKLVVVQMYNSLPIELAVCICDILYAIKDAEKLAATTAAVKVKVAAFSP